MRSTFVCHPELAPSRKFRGKRRYFRRVRRDAERFSIEPLPDSWWDHWHYHADWPGWGNLKWRYRVQHIRALCSVFDRITAAAPLFATPFQTWIRLDPADAGQDAVYLHTPNANGTPFPVQFDDVAWGTPQLEALLERIAGRRFRVGQCEGKIIAYAQDIGVPVEGPLEQLGQPRKGK